MPAHSTSFPPNEPPASAGGSCCPGSVEAFARLVGAAWHLDNSGGSSQVTPYTREMVAFNGATIGSLVNNSQRTTNVS